MKKVFSKIAVFVLLFFLLDAFIYQEMTRLFERLHVNPVRAIEEQKPDILFFGSSLTLHGINPAVFEETLHLKGYNLAEDGHGIEFAEGISSAIVSRYRPRIVVLEVMGSFSIEQQLLTLAPYLDEKNGGEILDSLQLRLRIRYRVFKTLRYNFWFLKVLKALFVPTPLHNGYMPLTGSDSQYEKRRKMRRQEREILFKMNKVSETADPQKGSGGEKVREKFLRGFIESYQKRSVRVVFLKMPKIGYDHRKEYELYKKLAQEYEIPFLDFTYGGNQFVDFPDDYFWDDGDHLNQVGAGQFTSILGRELVKLLTR